MIDRTISGARVETPFTIRTAYRDIPGHLQGTVLYAIDNGVGRMLIEVKWDDNNQSPVFLSDIVFLNQPDKPG